MGETVQPSSLKYAPEYDPSQSGPIKKRNCTDVICCILFVVCIVGYICLSGWAYMRGDIEKLLYPSDSFGNVCGTKEYENKSKLFFFNLMVCVTAGATVLQNGCPTPQVCVESCPDEYWTWITDGININEKPTSDLWDKLKPYCKYNASADTTLKELIEQDDCPAYWLKSSSNFGRCLPIDLSSLVDKVDEYGIKDAFQSKVNGTALADTAWMSTLLSALTYLNNIVSDLGTSWKTMSGLIAIGILLAFVWIVLMRFIAGIIVWITLILSFIILAFTSYYSVIKCIDLKENATSITQIELTTDLEYWSNLWYTWIIAATVSCLLFLIIFLILVFLRKRIKIAVSLVKESSRAVSLMMFTLLWPVIPLILQLVVIFHWCFTAVYIASITDDKNVLSSVKNETNEDGITDYVIEVIDSACSLSNTSTAQGICTFISSGGSEYIWILEAVALFMMLWCMNFVIAFGQMVLAGAFASYYWAYNKSKDIPTFPLLSSIGRTLFYHTGTLAFGSFIIALIQFIRIMLEYIDRKCKQNENMLTNFIMKCLKCCFWCFEKCMKFLNKNAYILCAVYGKNFCVSAKNAFFLILRNALRFIAVDKVTDFIIFIAELVVTGIIGLLSYYVYTGDVSTALEKGGIDSSWLSGEIALYYYFVPMIVVCFFTFSITVVFFSVYQMAVDTLLMCFLEDLERNDGSEQKPYYMSKELMKIVGKKNVMDSSDIPMNEIQK